MDQGQNQSAPMGDGSANAVQDMAPTQQPQYQEANMNQQQVAAPPKKKKKGCWVAIIILVVILACCGASAFVFSLAMGSVMEEARDINKEIVIGLCESLEPPVDTEMFSSRFKSEYTQEEIDIIVPMIFAGNGDCNELQFEGLWEMISSGQSVSLNTDNGVATAEYTFTNGNDQQVLLKFVQEGSAWKIDDVEIYE